MNLQTKIKLKKVSQNQISYSSKVLLLGSCFSENIGNKFNYFKFRANQNPFGILFHTKAIENLITNAIHKKEYKEEDLVFQNERWHCFDAHSSFSSVDKNAILERLNSRILSTKKQLEEANHIIITLGTSWVYRFEETATIVANCHKIPQKKFLKKLLSVDEIGHSLEMITSRIKSINKNVTIIFTVSPVRHLKDGFVENKLSKSHLITAIHQLLKNQNVSYFPSYEIMMDELRDYRFYAEDMIHPNNIAINYIWEQFIMTWFSEKTISIMKEIEIIQKGISHKPFHENSEQHQFFLKNLEEKIIKIKQEIPFLNFN